jgi:hypothetical protein
MAVVGGLVVPVSADVSAMQSGLRSAAKDVRMFGKDLKRFEGLGVGGIVGAVAGGGAAGFALQKLDQELGITEQLTKSIKDGWNNLSGVFSGTGSEGVKIAQQMADAEKEIVENSKASAQALKQRNEEAAANKAFAGAEVELRNQLALNQALAAARPEDRERVSAQLSLQQRLEKEKVLGVQQKILLSQQAAAQEAKDQMKWEDQRRQAAKDIAEAEFRTSINLANQVGELQKQAFLQGKDENFKMQFALDPRVRADPNLFGKALGAIQDIQDFKLAQRVQAELNKPLNYGPVAGLEKGSREEFSALAALRRELMKQEDQDKDIPKRALEIQKRILEDDKRREKQLDDIRRAIGRGQIKQVVF